MRKINKKSSLPCSRSSDTDSWDQRRNSDGVFHHLYGSLRRGNVEQGFSETIPKEDFSNWTKHVSVENTGDYDCYVRVKALAGSKYQDGLQYSDSDGKWTPGEDGYYYYSDPIAPGESTSVLDIRIDSKESDASFNVVVVQESTKVLYNENNEPYADWTQIADTSETTGE